MAGLFRSHESRRHDFEGGEPRLMAVGERTRRMVVGGSLVHPARFELMTSAFGGQSSISYPCFRMLTESYQPLDIQCVSC